MNETNEGPGSLEKPVESKPKLDATNLKEFLVKSNFLEEASSVALAEDKEVSEEKEEEEVEETEVSEEQQPEPEEEDVSSLTKGVQKRINKLVAAKKAAQAELEAQKAELLNLKSQLETKQVAKSRESGNSEAIDRIESLDQVRDEYKKAVEIIMWCDENPEGGSMPDSDGKEIEYDQSEVKMIKRFAMRRKEIELPERARFLQNQEAVDAEIVQTFPWWNKPETEEYQWAQMVLNDVPEIKKRRADWKHFAGLVVLGIKAFNEQKNSKKTPTPIKKAPIQPSVKAVPTALPGESISKAKQAFAKNNSDRTGLSELIKSMGFV